MSDNKNFFEDSENDYVVERNLTSSHSVASRNHIRDQIQSQVEAFLAKGGKIAEIPANVRAEVVSRADFDDSLSD